MEQIASKSVLKKSLTPVKRRRQRARSLSAEQIEMQTKLRELRKIAQETSTRLTKTKLGMNFTPKM